MQCENVGELRKLIEKLPDDARILPDWASGPPGDEDPAVVLRGFTIDKLSDGKEYLSTLVDIQYLDEFESDEDEFDMDDEEDKGEDDE